MEKGIQNYFFNSKVKREKGFLYISWVLHYVKTDGSY